MFRLVASNVPPPPSQTHLINETKPLILCKAWVTFSFNLDITVWKVICSLTLSKNLPYREQVPNDHHILKFGLELIANTKVRNCRKVISKIGFKQCNINVYIHVIPQLNCFQTWTQEMSRSDTFTTTIIAGYRTWCINSAAEITTFGLQHIQQKLVNL